MDNKVRKVTILDVATEADVSVATVSRALNNKENVKESTYNKVIKAAQKVGYDNYTIQHKSNLILILLPDINNLFYSNIVNGISVAAKRNNYQEIIVRTGNHPLTEELVARLVYETHVEGVITLDPVAGLETMNNLLKRIPLVQCAEHIDHHEAPYVSIDDMSASKLVVDNIIAKGKKKIALINGPLMYKYARKRKKGFILALEQAGIQPNPAYIVELPEFSYETAFSMATQLLSMADPPDAIFAASDVFAVAAMKAAKRLGLRIPEDVGVVGFDNTDISTMCDPPLTTVKQPQYQMGYLASEMLIEMINEKTTPPKQLLLDVELIVRESL